MILVLISLCVTDYCHDKEATYINRSKQKSTDGFIITSAQHDDENVLSLVEAKAPIILLGRDIDDSHGFPLDSVVFDGGIWQQSI